MNGGMVGGDGGLRIRVPMSLKRRGGRKEIVAAQGLPRRAKSAPQPHSALVLAVIRGHRWKELLESGRYPSIDALAARMGVNASYVGRHLNLALLAPDIVKAILMGREPDGLTLDKLQRMPAGWEELFPAEQERIVQLLVRRVEVGPDGLDLELRAEGLESLALELRSQEREEVAA